MANFYRIVFCFIPCICLFYIISQFLQGNFFGITLKRCLFSVLISLAVAVWGWKKKSLNWSGVCTGFFVGLIHSLSSYCFLSCLFLFFYTSSKATHFGSSKKKKFEADFKEGGQRNWLQVLCNGGTSSLMALIYLLYRGSGEFMIDFEKDCMSSWLSTATLAALAGANGDTWASEIGTVLSKEKPRLITTFQVVPVGTNGGFTKAGLVFSALGGVAVGYAYLIGLFLSGNFVDFSSIILLVCIGSFSGLFGSVFDSVVGATLQFSGFDTKLGKVVETPGLGVVHISGKPFLSNHIVNLIMTVICAITVPTTIAIISALLR